MATIESIGNTGILFTRGELDEVTGSDIKANANTYLSGEFDELTILQKDYTAMD
jgi:hypothetical protein